MILEEVYLVDMEMEIMEVLDMVMEIEVLEIDMVVLEIDVEMELERVLWAGSLRSLRAKLKR
jgi:hypothetical protein